MVQFSETVCGAQKKSPLVLLAFDPPQRSPHLLESSSKNYTKPQDMSQLEPLCPVLLGWIVWSTPGPLDGVNSEISWHKLSNPQPHL
jgi:hypothetical protein